MDFDHAKDINDVSLVVNSVTLLCHVSSFFVSIDSLVLSVSQYDSPSVSFVVEVASDQVRVEAMLLQDKRWWDFSLFVDVLFREHEFAIEVVDHVAFWVHQVAFVVDESSLTVLEPTILIVLRQDNVTFFVTSDIPQDIVFVETSAHVIRRDLYQVRFDLVLEVAHGVFSDQQRSNRTLSVHGVGLFWQVVLGLGYRRCHKLLLRQLLLKSPLLLFLLAFLLFLGF